MILKGGCLCSPRTHQPHLTQCFHYYEVMPFILMLSTGYSVRTKRSSQVNLATYQLEQLLMLALHILLNLTSTYAAIKVFRYVMTTVYDLTLTYCRYFIDGIDQINKIHSFSMLAETNPCR